MSNSRFVAGFLALLIAAITTGRSQGQTLIADNEPVAAARSGRHQWRGPNVDGVSLESNWSTNWPAEGPEILWRVEVGVPANNNDGSSAISVAGNRAFVVGSRLVYCLNVEDGKTLWKIPFPASHSTPAVQQGRVYVYGTAGRFVCLDAENGETLWSKDMEKDLGASRAGQYGYAASPILVGDLVLISARIDGGALVAFDRRTGELVWKARHKGHKGYALWSSPVPASIEGQPCIVWLPGPSVVGLNPKDGRTLWKYQIPEENGKVGCAPATPVVVGNRVIAQYHPPHARGYTFCLEIKDGTARVAWTSRDLANWYMSCVGDRGCLYGIDQRPKGRHRDLGALQCYDVDSGRLLWSINGFGQNGRRPVRQTRKLVPTGTFMIADGKMISWANELVVAEVSGEGHKVLASAKFPFVGYRTVPVLSSGRLFLRARNGQVVCLDVRNKD